MNYYYMIPPVVKPFKEMTEVEAKEYFDWFMLEIANRIELLSDYKKEEKGGVELDYSEESLHFLWKWFEKYIKFIDLSEDEYIEKINSYPDWMKNYISKQKISYETYKLLWDISIYFAEVVIKNSNGKIYWAFHTKPKNSESLNEPVLVGFLDDVYLNPRTIVEVLTRRSHREKDEYRLLNIYNVWKE